MSHIVIYQPPPGSPPAAFNVAGVEKIFQPPDAYWKRVKGKEPVIRKTKTGEMFRGVRPTLKWVLDEERNKTAGLPSDAGANRMTLTDGAYGFLLRHADTRFASKYERVLNDKGEVISERMTQGGFEFLVDLKDQEKILLNDAKREEERNAAQIVAIKALANARVKQAQEDEEAKTAEVVKALKLQAERKREALKQQFGLEEKEMAAVEAFIKEDPKKKK